jgi:hypothetical protein
MLLRVPELLAHEFLRGQALVGCAAAVTITHVARPSTGSGSIHFIFIGTSAFDFQFSTQSYSLSSNGPTYLVPNASEIGLSGRIKECIEAGRVFGDARWRRAS